MYSVDDPISGLNSMLWEEGGATSSRRVCPSSVLCGWPHLGPGIDALGMDLSAPGVNPFNVYAEQADPPQSIDSGPEMGPPPEYTGWTQPPQPPSLPCLLADRQCWKVNSLLRAPQIVLIAACAG